MIRELLWKDLSLHRRLVRMVLGAATLGVALSLWGRTAGGIGLAVLAYLFLTLVVYLPIRTIVEEQRDGTAFFVLSLPVRVEDYAIAKVLANVGLFLVPTLALAAVCRWVLPHSGAPGTAVVAELLRSGWIPVGLATLLTVFSLGVAVALTAGSTGWTVGAVAITVFLVGTVVPGIVPRFEAGRRWIEAITNGDPIVGVFVLAQLGLAAALLLGAVRLVVRRRQYV